MRADRVVAASSNSPLGVTACGATRAHLPQAVQAPASKAIVSAVRLSAVPGQTEVITSTSSRVSFRGRNAGGVGSVAAEPSGLAG